MKDHRDRQTADLLASSNARRQARFADQQRALGRRARKIWATDDEAEALRLYLDDLRRGDTSGTSP